MKAAQISATMLRVQRSIPSAIIVQHELYLYYGQEESNSGGNICKLNHQEYQRV
jgi:hypothetical protein